MVVHARIGFEHRRGLLSCWSKPDRHFHSGLTPADEPVDGAADWLECRFFQRGTVCHVLGSDCRNVIGDSGPGFPATLFEVGDRHDSAVPRRTLWTCGPCLDRRDLHRCLHADSASICIVSRCPRSQWNAQSAGTGRFQG